MGGQLCTQMPIILTAKVKIQKIQHSRSQNLTLDKKIASQLHMYSCKTLVNQLHVYSTYNEKIISEVNLLQILE